MPPVRHLPRHEADLLALEAITDCPAGMIDGYVIILTTTGNDSRIITNACCVWHAIRHAANLATEHLDGISPCSREQS